MGKLKILSENIDDLLVKSIEENDNEEDIDEAIKGEHFVTNFAVIKVLVSLLMQLMERVKFSKLHKFVGDISRLDKEMDSEIHKMSNEQEREFHKRYMSKIRELKNKILEELGDDFLDGIEEKIEDKKE